MSTKTDHLTTQLADQLDWHWRQQLRPRLDGLTDDEYFWEPGAGLLDGASRRGHRLRVSRRRNRSRSRRSRGGWRTSSSASWRCAPTRTSAARPPTTSRGTTQQTPTTALRQLDDAYAGLDRRAFSACPPPISTRRADPPRAPWADRPMTDLVLHINREVIHHGAEIALLRDLYARTAPIQQGELTMPATAPIRRRRARRPCGVPVSTSSSTRYHALAFGLTDEQARSTPTVSALSIGGLIKHVTGCQHMAGWSGSHRHRSFPPPTIRGRSRSSRRLSGRVRDARPTRPSPSCLTRFEKQNAETLRIRRRRRSRRRRPGPAGRAVVPEGPRPLVGALGHPSPDQGVGPARRPGRHHPREHRRRNDVRPDRGPGGLAGDRLDQAVEACGVAGAITVVAGWNARLSATSSPSGEVAERRANRRAAGAVA